MRALDAGLVADERLLIESRLEITAWREVVEAPCTEPFANRHVAEQAFAEVVREARLWLQFGERLAAALGRVLGRLFVVTECQRQLEVVREDTLEAVDDILTEEQLEEFKRMQEETGAKVTRRIREQR